MEVEPSVRKRPQLAIEPSSLDRLVMRDRVAKASPITNANEEMDPDLADNCSRADSKRRKIDDETLSQISSQIIGEPPKESNGN